MAVNDTTRESLKRALLYALTEYHGCDGNHPDTCSFIGEFDDAEVDKIVATMIERAPGAFPLIIEEIPV